VRFAGVCVCNEGFDGADCSVNLTAAPEINLVAPSLTCDLDSERCGFVMIVGGPFVNSGDLECVFQTVEVLVMIFFLPVFLSCLILFS
jgi:hypothetical protein